MAESRCLRNEALLGLERCRVLEARVELRFESDTSKWEFFCDLDRIPR